jgi:MFS family permease
MRSVLLGPIVDRLGAPWAMRLGAGLIILGLVLYPLVGTLWVLVVVMATIPIGTALLFPATTSLVSRFSEPHELGATMGIAQTFAGIARAVSPIVATKVFQELGHGWPFYLAAAAIGCSMLLSAKVQRGSVGSANEVVEPAR